MLLFCLRTETQLLVFNCLKPTLTDNRTKQCCDTRATAFPGRSLVNREKRPPLLIQLQVKRPGNKVDTREIDPSSTIHYENEVLFSNDTGKLGKRNSECSYKESNLRSSDYKFGCSTTELQETHGS